jgi:soluble lytic murein transglycosylase-like protein
MILFYCCLAAWVVDSHSPHRAGREETSRQKATVRPGEPFPSVAAVQPPNAVALLFRELSRCRRSLPENVRWHIAGAIHDQSRSYGYDPLFVVAMVKVESTCSPSAVGPKGAVGLIQLDPRTARAVSREVGLAWSGAAMLTRPVVNLRLGLHYLWTLEQRLNDPYVALAAYNMGPGRVAGMGRRQARETRYVRKVFDHYEELLKQGAPRVPSAVGDALRQ